MTRICIVTVAAGDRSGLSSTVASVDQQTTPPHQHILVLNRVPARELEKVSMKPYRELVIDQDKSLYDAMNLGLAIASGDLILFLNGGDTLYRPSTLATVARKWDRRSIVSGRSLQVFGKDLYLRPAMGRLSDLYWSAPHQSFFCPLAGELPKYRDTGKIGADSLWMSQVREIFPQQVISDIVCRFELGGISNSPSVRTLRSRLHNDGVKVATKEFAKMLLHRVLGQRRAYQILYSHRYAHCRLRSDRAYRFPAETF